MFLIIPLCESIRAGRAASGRDDAVLGLVVLVGLTKGQVYLEIRPFFAAVFLKISSLQSSKVIKPRNRYNNFIKGFLTITM